MIATHRGSVCACACCGPIATQLHNCFQFPSPACSPGGSPPTAALCCLPASLLGGLGQIRADQFRVSLLTQFTEQTVPEDRTASRWTFLSSSGIRNSGDDGKVSAEVSNVLLLLIICARTENPSAAVGRVTFQPNFDATGCPSLPPPSLPCSPLLPPSPLTQSASRTHAGIAVCSRKCMPGAPRLRP